MSWTDWVQTWWHCRDRRPVVSIEHDIDEELAFHFESLVDELRSRRHRRGDPQIWQFDRIQ